MVQSYGKSNSMNEVQRLTYLAHLGIDHYVSRRSLPGAAPSVETAFVSIDPNTTEPETESGIDSNVTAINASDLPANTQAETVRFSLNCWRIDDDLLIIDSHEPGVALPTDTLLLNIVRSIGRSLTQLPKPELLRWPLFEHDQHANDQNQAHAMVQAYIQAQTAKKPVAHLVLMGATAARFSLNEFDDWRSVEGKSFQQWQMTLTLIPSLADMLREPLLKSVAWGAIKRLGK